ncbi:helix-turn-helix transcriptional regulator [Nonomuraea gerenzanensis]|uniref:Putative DNA-binding protein n=1 Tax=Nonomuraea gerenzanensis TaxID=93944 RepID=A0A1M4E5C1_9ACTN|nr:helix-turn-helix transcriptional regulator [Nonomuraea gerenzanensis]UBU16225.1 helix-turn-helix transcriptional regulator [Nonomuraea gerenzanensis]SBO94039.1 putative DNA-binding protein [Nonomuraea gerenzanensis]
MDLRELGAFLKSRRDRLAPQSVGLPSGTRRRVPGLRRDEVAELAGVSIDYYTELEQGRGQCPSEPVLHALARALALDPDESAHAFHLAGHPAPYGAEPLQMQSALRQLMDRLPDTPAMVITDLHEVVVQNHAAQVLVGPQAGLTGLRASFLYHWFTVPATRDLYPPDDHDYHSRLLVCDLRAAVARRGPADPAARALVDHLLGASAEFAGLWRAHEVGVRHEEYKRVVNPVLGTLKVTCNSIVTADAAQRLLWFVPDDADAVPKLHALDPAEVWRDTPGPAFGLVRARG